jgi:RNA polymerase sigma factor for flagellar operon FliA
MDAASRPPEDSEQPALTAEELWNHWKETGDDSFKDRLVELHLPLVRFIAERMCANLPPSVNSDDLAQEGIFGLIDAIGKFDPEHGVKFKTYCSTRVRGAMYDALRTQDWVPRLVRKRAAMLAEVRRIFLARYGCEPTDTELAKALDLPEEELDVFRKKAEPRAVHSESDRRVTAESDTNPDIDTLGESDESNPLEVVKRRDLMEVLTRALTEKERSILELYYHKGLTLREIGLRLNLTESRVCQIHSHVIKRLRERHGSELG